MNFPAEKFPRIERTADTLKRGDVFDMQYVNRSMKWKWVAVIEESDSVATIPLDQDGLPGIPATQCCEPRVVLLGTRGQSTHEASYFIVRNARKIKVAAFLDLDIRGARPEPHPEAKT